MPPSVENRLKALEDWRTSKGVQQITYPLDFGSIKTVQDALSEELSVLLHPLETAAAGEGTHTLLNNTPCIQFADAATNEGYFAFGFTGNISVSSMEFLWSTPATSGNLYWQVDIDAASDSENTNVRTTGGTAVARAADGTADDIDVLDMLTANAGVNLGALASPDPAINLWGIKFSRLGGNSLDTLTNTVNLYGILMKYKLFNAV